MNGTELPVHISPELMPGGLETFQVRLKRPSYYGQLSVVQVRAVDLQQAEAVGRRYCSLNKFTFVAVVRLVVADPSILDEPAPH